MTGTIYITGDKHGTYAPILGLAEHNQLREEDVLLIAGDAGYVWDESYAGSIATLQQFFPGVIAFVDGNHENHALLNAMEVCTWNGGRVHRVGDRVLHLMRGELYRIHGRTVFAFGGARSVDVDRREDGFSWWKEPGASWWPEEEPTAEEIARGAAAYEPAGSRMRVVRLRGGRLILDDCYNANPQSVTAALEVLAKTECGRKTAVLGDMGELGALTDQAHYNMGALAAMLGIDEVIAIGTKAEKIADGAAQSGGSVTHFATKEEAIRSLTGLLSEDTAMLVKASHAMQFGWIVEQLRKAYD